MHTDLVELLKNKGILSDMEASSLMMGESCHEKWAKSVVDKMHHTYNGVFYKGEKYSMEEAISVYHAYKHKLKETVKHYHVYIAINAQYHDYCPLFKDWHLDDIDGKIKEAAISFWFLDEDYQGCKISNYFK